MTRDSRASGGKLRSLAILAALMGVLLTVIATALIPEFGTGGRALGRWPHLAGFLLLFLFCDTTRLELRIRRHGYSVNLSEVALVIGLILVPPLGLIVVRAVAMIAVLVFQRLPLGKVIVNLVIGLAEASLAVFLFGRLFDELGQSDPARAGSWLAAYAAVGFGLLLSAAAVVVAITAAQGWPGTQTVNRMLLSSALAGLLNVTVGLVVVMLLAVNPYSAALLVVLAGVLVAGYRAYAQFLRQHKSLTELYEFTRSVGAARQEGQLADALLTRTRELLNAESATLWLPAFGRYPEVRLTARIDSPGVVDEVVDLPVASNEQTRRAVLERGETVHIGQRNGFEERRLRPAALRGRRAEELIAVPLRSGTAVVGCLEVANRLGDLASFGSSDVRLLETLAAHAAVAVENNRLIDRLRHDAHHDGLTGLPNRRRFVAALDEAIKVEPAPGEVVAVLQFDVDNLRDVNDTLGHVAGDRLLAEVGRRLVRFAPDGGLVGRVGGDEFTLLLRTDGADGATAVGVALQYALNEPFVVDTFTLDVAAAVGISLFPDNAQTAELMLQRADVATHAAKSNPRGLLLYSPAMESRSVHRLGLVSDLRRALDADELTVHFQPKVALTDNGLIGVECLVRWRHPEQGLVAPDDFIPVAEHAGLIIPITRVVLRAALKQVAAWAASGRELEVAVNLSARCLADLEFPSEVEALLAEFGVPPQWLTLEITEGGMVGDAERPLPALHRLHQLGIRLSLDDFGTGHSSLSYLRRLPVDEVKIDKTFVLGMATDAGDLAIVRSIVDLSRNLGHSVVAEGVETEMTLRLLREMGCDAAQGFYFSRPLPVERIDAWMAARTECASLTAGTTTRLRVVGP
jgi:diguanylate cyclase (GGDEF)-like protein